MKRTLIILLSVLSLSVCAQSDKLVRRITYELGKVEGSIPQINMLMKKGEKVQAREMVDAALKQMEQIEAYQKEAALDGSYDEEDLLIPQAQETKRFLVNKANQLKNGIGVYIQCDAQLFGDYYSTIKDELQGRLADLGCSFVEEKEQADWAINITSSTREGNKMTNGNFTTYFSYVDLKLSIEKVANGKCVYQSAFSEKGGDTRNYSNAAKEAYQELSSKISEIIKQQIKQ